MSEAEPPSASHSERTRAAEFVERLSVYALIRTEFSSERALMSWIRTSVSLYTFGFSITKFFDYVGQQSAGAELAAGPRRLGLALVFLGIVWLALAMRQHVRRVRVMRELGLPVTSRFSLPVCVGGALLAIGIATLIVITSNL